MLAEFHFLRPLWLLALVPVAIVLWRLRTAHTGAGPWRRVCDAHLLPHLLVVYRHQRRPWLVLLGAGWLVSVLALSGPTWTRLAAPVFKDRSARVLVLDLSLSMRATDLRPDRMARARFKTLDILRRSRAGQTALVVFANEAYVVSPLTDDANTIAALVPVLAPGLMPGQGSRLDRALDKADDLLRQAGVRGGEVILITDGLSDEDATRDALSRLLREGARVSVLGVGTAQGAPVPLARGGFLKDADGAIVIPRLDGATLGAVARAGHGRYLRITPDDSDVTRILAPHVGARDGDFEKTDLSSEVWRDDGVWLVLLLLPAAAFAFRRGLVAAVLLAVIGAPQPARAFGWADLWQRHDQQAARLLDEGRPAQAAERFRDKAWRATAYYRAGNYDLAADAFASSAGADGHYNRGNALARSGKLGDAIEAYQAALERDPAHEDARFNKALIEKLMQRQIGNDAGEQRQRPHGDSASASRPEEGAKRKEGSPGGAAGRGEPSGGDASAPDAGYPEADATDDGKSADSSSATSSDASSLDPAEKQRDAHGDESDAAKAKDTESAGPPQGLEEPMSDEARQALEQWLRRIPDDPGGLLRRKLLLEYRRRRIDGTIEHAMNPW